MGKIFVTFRKTQCSPSALHLVFLGGVIGNS